jgi:hypothetical protein
MLLCGYGARLSVIFTCNIVTLSSTFRSLQVRNAFSLVGIKVLHLAVGRYCLPRGTAGKFKPRHSLVRGISLIWQLLPAHRALTYSM